MIFSRAMSLAIRRGQKTQTRRVVKNPGYSDSVWFEGTPHDESQAVFGGGPYLRIAFDEEKNLCGQRIRCPYGRVGDRLWVREQWWHRGQWRLRCGGMCECGDDPSDYYWNGWKPNENTPPTYVDVCRRFDEPSREEKQDWRKRPSIHMPRWACRTVLEIAEVRIQRLQDITWQDALAEGVEAEECSHQSVLDGYGCSDCMNTGLTENPVDVFAQLWDKINAKRGCPWESNPWVWALSFTFLAKSETHGVQSKAN